MTARQIADAYLATWNAADAQACAALLDRHWTRDAEYVDPMVAAAGTAQIGATIAAVRERFPGFAFTLLGEPDGHGDHVRLRWTLGPAGVPAPIEGSDVITVRDGRIDRVVGFLDRVPAEA